MDYKSSLRLAAARWTELALKIKNRGLRRKAAAHLDAELAPKDGNRTRLLACGRKPNHGSCATLLWLRFVMFRTPGFEHVDECFFHPTPLRLGRGAAIGDFASILSRDAPFSVSSNKRWVKRFLGERWTWNESRRSVRDEALVIDAMLRVKYIASKFRGSKFEFSPTPSQETQDALIDALVEWKLAEVAQQRSRAFRAPVVSSRTKKSAAFERALSRVVKHTSRRDVCAADLLLAALEQYSAEAFPPSKVVFFPARTAVALEPDILAVVTAYDPTFRGVAAPNAVAAKQAHDLVVIWASLQMGRRLRRGSTAQEPASYASEYATIRQCGSLSELLTFLRSESIIV